MPYLLFTSYQIMKPLLKLPPNRPHVVDTETNWIVLSAGQEDTVQDAVGPGDDDDTGTDGN